MASVRASSENPPDTAGFSAYAGRSEPAARELLQQKLDRLLRLSCAVTAVLLLAVVLLGDLAARNQALDAQVSALAHNIARNAAPSVALAFKDSRSAEENLKALRYVSNVDLRIGSATLFDQNGALVAQYVPDDGLAEDAAALPAGSPAPGRGERARNPAAPGPGAPAPARSWHWLVVSQPLLEGEETEPVGHLELVVDRTSIVWPWLRQGLLLLLGTGVVVGLAWRHAIGLSREITLPIENMAAQARRIGGQVEYLTGAPLAGVPAVDSDVRLLPGTAIDEFVRLADDFNGLLAVMRRQASEDSLTGLPNRRSFLLTLARQLRQSATSGEALGLLFLDLDNFKMVNDTLGHAVGDRLLVESAARLRSLLPAEVRPFRLGGDEFILIAPHLRDRADLKAIAGHLVDAFRVPFLLDGKDLFVTVSIGIAVFPEDADNADDLYTLVRHADTAMYAAKRSGRARAEFFTLAMGEQNARNLSLESGLHMALTRRELSVEYQPKVDLQTGALIGAEALLRWNSPHLGRVSPDEFIPLAEANGLIVLIGRFVLESACAQLQAWRAMRSGAFSLAVNVSLVQFRVPRFVQYVLELIERFGLAPGELELELTESCLIDNIPDTLRKLEELRRHGVLIAIDDFGTGFSSMNQLRRLPATSLKIDQTFVASLAEGERERGVVRSILQLAEALGLASVGEGVESPEQAEFLRAAGCRVGQGFLFGRAMPAETFSALLAPHRRYQW